MEEKNPPLPNVHEIVLLSTCMGGDENAKISETHFENTCDRSNRNLKININAQKKSHNKKSHNKRAITKIYFKIFIRKLTFRL